MKQGDTVRVSRRSAWRKSFGDVEGLVQEADPKDGRCTVHFPTLGLYAQGLQQSEFEAAEANHQQTKASGDR